MINITAKELEKKITSLLKKHEVSPIELKNCISSVRKNCDMQEKSLKSKKLPALPTNSEVAALFTSISNGQNLTHLMFFRLLQYTGLRVSEALNIQIRDIDIEAKKIHIHEGKGSKDRIIPIHKNIEKEMIHFITASRKTNKTFLFETTYSGKRIQISVRGMQKTLERYVEKSNIDCSFSPHTFRHLAITQMTKSDMSTAKIQKISGHSSQKNLEIYQHLIIEDIAADFDKAMKGLN